MATDLWLRDVAWRVGMAIAIGLYRLRSGPLASRRRKAALAAILAAGSVALALLTGWPWVLLVASAVVLGPFAGGILRRGRELVRLLRARPGDGRPAAPERTRAALVAWGLPAERARALVAESLARPDRRWPLAEWGGEGHVFCPTDPLPGLGTVVPTRADLPPTKGNRVSLVLLAGGLVLIKRYRRFARFVNEAGALVRLQDVATVPDLVGRRIVAAELCRAFIIGESVESRLVAAGLDNGTRRCLDHWGQGRRPADAESEAIHRRALTVVRQAIPPGAIDGLETVLREMHRRGLVHRDLKYRNLFLASDHIIIGDFDLARGDLAGPALVEARLTDWRRFNLAFGRDVPTDEDLPRLAGDGPERLAVRLILAPGHVAGPASAPDAHRLARLLARHLGRGALVVLGAGAVPVALAWAHQGLGAASVVEPDPERWLAAQRLLRLAEVMTGRPPDQPIHATPPLAPRPVLAGVLVLATDRLRLLTTPAVWAIDSRLVVIGANDDQDGIPGRGAGTARTLPGTGWTARLFEPASREESLNA